MTKILGKLKGINLKSKELEDGDLSHTIEMKIELLEGLENIQDVSDLLKQIIEINLDSRQPTL